MKKLLIGLSLAVFLVSSLAMAKTANESLRERTIKNSNIDKEVLENKLDVSGIDEAEALLIIEEFELKVDQDLEEISELSESESANLLKKPLFCTYDYRYHFSLTRLGLKDIGSHDFTSEPASGVFGVVVGLPLALIIDTVMTPVSAWLAYAEPRNDQRMKDMDCY